MLWDEGEEGWWVLFPTPNEPREGEEDGGGFSPAAPGRDEQPGSLH